MPVCYTDKEKKRIKNKIRMKERAHGVSVVPLMIIMPVYYTDKQKKKNERASPMSTSSSSYDHYQYV